MYSTKEKLNHFRQLVNPDAAEADLHLLTEKASANSNLTRYSLSPKKNVEDILFELLDVCTHEEIVRNRRDLLKEPKVKLPAKPKIASKKSKSGKAGKAAQKKNSPKTKENASEAAVPAEEMQQSQQDASGGVSESDNEKKSQ